MDNAKPNSHEIPREAMDNFTIPMEKRKMFEETHVYDGVTLLSAITASSLDYIKKMEAREDDIMVASFPKSGTHWMWEIVLLILADGYPEKINRHDMLSTSLEFPYPPEFKRPSYEVIEEIPTSKQRVFLCHLPFKLLPRDFTQNKKGKVVYVRRNPKDVLASGFRFASAGTEKGKQLWEFSLEMFHRCESSHGSWFDHVLGYWEHRNNENFFIAEYESMKKNLSEIVSDLSKFLDHPLDQAGIERVTENASLKGMRKSYDDIEKVRDDGTIVTKFMGQVPFIQKGVTGSWKHIFTVAENEKFDSLFKEKMAQSDMPVTFE